MDVSAPAILQESLVSAMALTGAVEGLVSRRPLVVRRVVKWGDCDPARVVYTPRFAEFSVSAIGFFSAHVLGLSDEAQVTGTIGLPMRAMAMEYFHFLAAGEAFEMTVYVSSIGSRTFGLDLRAANEMGRRVFRSQMTPICLDTTRGQAIEIPDTLRRKLEDYAGTCPLPEGTGA